MVPWGLFDPRGPGVGCQGNRGMRGELVGADRWLEMPWSGLGCCAGRDACRAHDNAELLAGRRGQFFVQRSWPSGPRNLTHPGEAAGGPPDVRRRAGGGVGAPPGGWQFEIPRTHGTGGGGATDGLAPQRGGWVRACCDTQPRHVVWCRFQEFRSNIRPLRKCSIRFTRRKQSPSRLIEVGRQIRESLPNGGRIDHTYNIW